jgi:ComF family protein
MLGVLYQVTCAACGADLPLAGGVCRFCREWLPLRGPLCPRCGWPLTQSLSACGECARRKRPALKAARSLFWLDEASRALIHRVKYQGRFEYLDLFAPEIARRFAAFFDGHPVVVPVPLHPARLTRRGFNQAEWLSRTVARHAGLPLDVDGLRKVRATRSQARLSAAERGRNVRGSFAWRSARTPERVLLVDDIYTTGATLQAAARALRGAGVAEVYGWTLFRVPDRT